MIYDIIMYDYFDTIYDIIYDMIMYDYFDI